MAFRLLLACSIWLYQVQEALRSVPSHASLGQNPELNSLFLKLARLLRTCVLPIFVFDGPGRPPTKHGRKVVPVVPWLTQDFQRIIDAFGFCSHQVSFHTILCLLCTHECCQAPGEAEAELAWLNATGAIDAVLSEDSDTFLFGATHVIRQRSVAAPCQPPHHS